MTVRGVRGATTVEANDRETIISTTQALLREMVSENGIRTEDLAAAYFTMTEDLNAAFPAYAARALGSGWQQVPLLDARQIPVPDSLQRCVRVLLLWNSDVPQSKVIHIYQENAQTLRPDLRESQASGVRKERKS